MSLRLSRSRSKNSVSFYVICDARDPQTGKRSSAVYERLGTLEKWQKELHTDSEEVVVDHLKTYIRGLEAERQKGIQPVSIVFNPAADIPKGKKRLYNAGYLYPYKILSTLGLRDICKNLSNNSKIEYELDSILYDYVCGRIIFPESKFSTFHDVQTFLHKTPYKLHDVYRAIQFIAAHRYEIEKALYVNSTEEYKRNTDILFYDCTNFFFEIEEASGEKQYGKSKENRPNPIVQYGLFMDGNGIPLADYVFSGNRNEQPSLRNLECIIEKDFGISRMIVCADAGLNGFENKIFNSRTDKAFIVTQPIKKLKKSMQEWALDPEGWSLLQTPGVTYNIADLPERMTVNGKSVNTDTLVFYKDRWDIHNKKSSIDGKKKKLEERTIVSFSTKYKKYLEHIRDKKLERANSMLTNPGKLEKKDPRSPKYFIEEVHNTKNGEVADETSFAINWDKVEEDKKYDGFYAVCSNLEDKDIGIIIEHNRQRWEIEESFRLMKEEFKTRPIYVSKDEAINGHLLICFIALLVFRLLEQKVGENYTAYTIIDALREMNITNIKGMGYVPSFDRSDISDRLAEVFGFGFSKEFITNESIKLVIKNCNSKKNYAKSK